MPTQKTVPRSILHLVASLAIATFLPLAATAQDGPAFESLELDKRDAPASRLLLPYYTVDMNNPAGASTLWALRNESLLDLTVTIEYYEADSPQAPQIPPIEIVLSGKEVRTGNIRDVANLEVDGDGFARGFVVFTAEGNRGDLYGDYFVITSDQDFAEGSLLVDATDTVDSDLCNLFSLRFLKGGGFGGSTDVIIWVESDTAPLAPGTVTYSLYNAAGELLSFDNLFLDVVTTRFDIDSLAPDNLNGGALEIQFAEGVRGHVALAMAATGRYSVGFDAVCKN
ncbi:MAG: hypothetical protein MPN21_03450 [Thermoanaerobaculia bacterium]|nr:hypothetical protein [Thermoanaerobaculia bacterium]